MVGMKISRNIHFWENSMFASTQRYVRSTHLSQPSSECVASTLPVDSTWELKYSTICVDASPVVVDALYFKMVFLHLQDVSHRPFRSTQSVNQNIQILRRRKLCSGRRTTLQNGFPPLVGCVAPTPLTA
ncbi:unnamed protein product [Vicia faba]|uniref:Uncharacterized protein n=1 Tax=Vicia faba TaxID=3906 RepID=A0AAV0Z9W6_VICFA|nr:unnamed protein product [Vicia faba]